MGSKRVYNWALMDTSPMEIVLAQPNWRFGAGELPPENVNWALTPQGARFWFKAFMTGDKRAALAVDRMLRQAQRDLSGPRTPPGRLAYVPPVYDIARMAPSAEHILRLLPHIAHIVGKPPMGIQWAATPQGPAYWYSFWAAKERDPKVLKGLEAAAKRALALKGGTGV